MTFVEMRGSANCKVIGRISWVAADLEGTISTMLRSTLPALQVLPPPPLPLPNHQQRYVKEADSCHFHFRADFRWHRAGSEKPPACQLLSKYLGNDHGKVLGMHNMVIPSNQDRRRRCGESPPPLFTLSLFGTNESPNIRGAGCSLDPYNVAPHRHHPLHLLPVRFQEPYSSHPQRILLVHTPPDEIRAIQVTSTDTAGKSGDRVTPFFEQASLRPHPENLGSPACRSTTSKKKKNRGKVWACTIETSSWYTVQVEGKGTGQK